MVHAKASAAMAHLGGWFGRPFRFLDRMILVLFVFDVLETIVMLMAEAGQVNKTACTVRPIFVGRDSVIMPTTLTTSVSNTSELSPRASTGQSVL